MPKIIRFIPLLILIFSLNISHAKTFNGFVDLNNVNMQKIQVNGSADLENSKFKSLVINGALDFKNLIVSDSIKINGAIEGKNLKCNQLIVDGSLEGYKITVTENTIVNGFLNVHDSFFKELNINAKKIILNNTSTKNITIKSVKNKFKQQLILKGKTIVNGDIIFESSLGEVLLDNQSKITGQVKGGKISHTKTTT